VTVTINDPSSAKNPSSIEPGRQLDPIGNGRILRTGTVPSRNVPQFGLALHRS
jgi:hypothetical protein